MAILINKKGISTYVSSTGLVTDEEKKKADDLDKELKNGIELLEKSLVARGLVTKEGVKKNALRVWFEFGVLLDKIGKKYKIFGTTDEPYYWQAIYSYVSHLIQKKTPPLKYQDLLRNHFKQCSIIAQMKWSIVRQVGSWAEWRDILDNKVLLYDSRVFDWLIKTIIKSRSGHKEMRPFLHKTRQQLNRLDTKVLTDKELKKLLKTFTCDISYSKDYCNG